jgi:hypothetical protein
MVPDALAQLVQQTGGLQQWRAGFQGDFMARSIRSVQIDPRILRRVFL